MREKPMPVPLPPADAKQSKHIRMKKSDRALLIVFYTIAALFALLCLYPFYQVLISSFADETTLIREGYKLFPSKLSADAYRTLFSSAEIPYAYGITIFVTAVGTVLSLLVTAMAAYALSGKKLKYRNVINFFFYFTMLFSGGLIPYYILIKNYLHLSNTLLVYIVPGMFNVWNMFLLRNFFGDIPDSLREAARIDGASEAKTAFRIILPLSLRACDDRIVQRAVLLERMDGIYAVYRQSEAVYAAISHRAHGQQYFGGVQSRSVRVAARSNDRTRQHLAFGDGNRHDRTDYLAVSVLAEVFRCGTQGRRSERVRDIRTTLRR